MWKPPVTFRNADDCLWHWKVYKLGCLCEGGVETFCLSLWTLLFYEPLSQRNRRAEGGSHPMCRNKIVISTFPSFLIFPLFYNAVCSVPFFSLSKMGNVCLLICWAIWKVKFSWGCFSEDTLVTFPLGSQCQHLVGINQDSGFPWHFP